MRALLRTAFIMLLLVVIGSALSGSVLADDTKFRFKWPYGPGVFAPTTTNPGEGGHNAHAWDFDIVGSGVNGVVVSSAEGAVTFATSEYEPESCDPNDGGGFGNHVLVEVPLPDPDPDITVTYAHLKSASVSSGRILQGDQIGIEGKTGHTHGSEAPGFTHPPPEGFDGCGTHLHFQFNPARPSHIDGMDVSGGPDGGDSTNSEIKELNVFDVPGAAIRQRYWDLGDVFTSWAVAGWTADRTETQAGCPPSSFCRLYVHYIQDPDTGPSGSRIELRKHEQLFDWEGTPVAHEINAIMVGRWATSDAYYVEIPFHLPWLFPAPIGPVYYLIGVPVADRLGGSSGTQCGLAGECCPTSAGCVSYQRFHVGYIWEHETDGIQGPFFCPDVAAPNDPNSNFDYVVRTPDISAVVQDGFGSDAPSPPYAAWDKGVYDVDSSGYVRIPDIVAVVNGFGRDCVAGGPL